MFLPGVLPAGIHRLLDGLEACLCRLGGCHELGQEEDPLLEALPHHVERGDEDLVDGEHGVVLLDDLGHHLGHGSLAAGKHKLAGTGGGICGLGGRRGSRRRDTGRGRRGLLGGRRRRWGTVASLRIVGDKVLGALVLAREHAPGVDHVHHAGETGVDDGKVKAGREGRRQEGPVHERPEGQAEAYVAHPKHGANAGKLLLDQSYGVENGPGLGLVRRGGHGEAVYDHVMAWDAELLALANDLPGNGETAPCRCGDAVLVEGEPHHRATVVLHDGEHVRHGLGLAVG